MTDLPTIIVSTTDWATIVVSAVAGLVGAAIGGGAPWLGVLRSGKDARALARTEREADERSRRLELLRNAAMNARTVATEALTHLNNLSYLEGLRKRRHTGPSAEQLADAAKDGVDAVRQVILQQGYLLPDPVRSRLDELYMLMSQAVYGDASDPDFYHERVGVDVQNYGRYLQLSLEALIHETEMPRDFDPPVLRRGAGDAWIPDPLPAGWYSSR